MNKERRVFDTTFKLEVVKLIKEQGVSVGQVCTDMSIGAKILSSIFFQ